MYKRQLINERKDSQYIVYQKQMPVEDKEKFENYKQEKNKEYRDLPAEEGGKQRITGVWFEEEYKRRYPYNDLACNIIGFALKDGNASGGVEQYYNNVLNGNNGREYGYLNDDSNLERTVKPAKNGQTLELTIDVNIQKICQKYIDEWQAGIGSDVAAVIATVSYTHLDVYKRQDHVGILEAADHMDDGVHLADIRQELVAEALALGGALYQAGDIHKLDDGRCDFLRIVQSRQLSQPRIRHRHDTHVGIDGAERIIGGFCPRFRQRVKKSAFSHIWESHDT